MEEKHLAWDLEKFELGEIKILTFAATCSALQLYLDSQTHNKPNLKKSMIILFLWGLLPGFFLFFSFSPVQLKKPCT